MLLLCYFIWSNTSSEILSPSIPALEKQWQWHQKGICGGVHVNAPKLLTTGIFNWIFSGVTVLFNLIYEIFGVNGFQNVGEATFSDILLLLFHKQLKWSSSEKEAWNGCIIKVRGNIREKGMCVAFCYLYQKTLIVVSVVIGRRNMFHWWVVSFSAGKSAAHLIWSFFFFFFWGAHCLGCSPFKTPVNVSRSRISSCALLKNTTDLLTFRENMTLCNKPSFSWELV